MSSTLGSSEIMSLADADLDEVTGGCAGAIILAACAAVAIYCTVKMALQ